MPLWVPPGGSGQFTKLATAKAGQTITASATPHAKGAWASVIDPIPRDVYALVVAGGGVSTGANATEQLLDIGRGPTGGGSEIVVLPTLDTGAAFTAGQATTKQWVFPLFIPAGGRLSARLQALIASDTVLLRVALYMAPLYADYPSRWVAYGASAAASRGTSVLGGSGAYDVWVQIAASTSRAHRWWHIGFDFYGDTTATAGTHRVEIGHGPSAGAVQSIGEWDFVTTGTAEDLNGPTPDFPVCRIVPAGSGLWARLNGTTAEARGVIIYAGD